MRPRTIPAAPRATLPRRAQAWLATAGRVMRAVLGAPDYDAYVAHVRARHPESRPMSRDQFVESRLRDRFERPGSRCC